jgi:hypothetical protein
MLLLRFLLGLEARRSDQHAIHNFPHISLVIAPKGDDLKERNLSKGDGLRERNLP